MFNYIDGRCGCGWGSYCLGLWGCSCDSGLGPRCGCGWGSYCLGLWGCSCDSGLGPTVPICWCCYSDLGVGRVDDGGHTCGRYWYKWLTMG